MLVLVSFGLVLLATILLVVGLLTDDGLNLIYLSIFCSFTAAVVLYLAFRRARPKHDVKAEPPAPLLPEGVDDEEPARVAAVAAVPHRSRDTDATTVQPAVAGPQDDVEADVNPGATPTAATAPAVDVAPEPAAAEPEPAVGAAASDDWVDDDDWADSGEFEVEFPIADYDELSAEEILPLLPQLYSDELEVVAERERSTKDRTAILARLAELAATGTEADALDTEDDEQPGVAAAPTTTTPAVAATEAPAAAAPPARPAPQVPSLSDETWDDEVPFPIADYDELSADQIIPLLSQLEDDELEDVKDREVAGSGRKSVITEIDRQLGLTGPGEGADDWAEPAAPAAPAPAAPSAAPEPRPTPVAETADSSMLAISGYDGLTVAEIRPLLAGLSAAELRAIREHEAARDDRRTIINDIDRRLASPEATPAPATPAARTPAKRTPAKRAPAKRAPRKSAERPTKAAARSTKRAAKKATNHRFPIDRYDTLTVAEIRPRLARLSARQLQLVRERELSGAGRKSILTEIERRLS